MLIRSLKAMIRRTPISIASGMLLPLLISGCMDLQVYGALDTPNVTIAASPLSIESGASTTLTVKATNAKQLTLTGSDGSSYQIAAGGGSQKVSPNQTTTYTATANGTGGTKAASVQVKVVTGSAPVVSISASPALINAGASSTLTVTAEHATSVTLTGSDGTKVALAAAGGTHIVKPAASTTYTAAAVSGTLKTTAVTTVSVRAGSSPSVSIAAEPALIKAGTYSKLVVAASNVTHVSVAGTDGSKYTLPDTGGVQAVAPETTTRYTVSGTNGSRTITAETTVAIRTGPPAVTIKAFPDSIKTGGSSMLTVTASNATTVTLAGTDGSKVTLNNTGGKRAVSPKATTTYTVTAAGPGGKSSAEVTITVSANPAPSLSISASPLSIKAGGTSTLTVTAVHATAVTVAGSDGTRYTLKAGGGTQSVHPAKTTTYTATATGTGGKASKAVTVTVEANPKPTVTIAADPSTIVSGNASTLKVTATNATAVKVAGTDGTSYTLQAAGGSQSVSPTKTTTYKATATGAGGTASASATLTVEPEGSIDSINHVIFMLQENHTFDNYFGMLNKYRESTKTNTGDNGVTYNVDGIDDKLTTITNEDDEGTSYSLFKLASTCIDDDSSDWLASYGDENRYDFLATRPILANGFVHTAEGFAKSCASGIATCSGQYTDLTGQRAMGYYDQDYLNYYYYMASQFAISDRWFSPVASKSIANRIATFTGGTTQGLVKDPGNDHLPQLNIPSIFSELDQANVSWKIYYTVTQGFCLTDDECTGGSSVYPATDFSNLQYSFRYMYKNPSGAACTPPTQPSSVVGDSGKSFCIDPEHVAPISAYFDDLKNGTLPSFAFIEAGYGRNDEHPGSGQSVLLGQAQVANIINSLMNSTSWSDSVFFLSYDEGGGPYEHVPPVPGHSNDFTNPAHLGATPPDISSIAVNPDATTANPKQYFPCVPPGGTPTTHCDLASTDPGAHPGDAAAVNGFAAQIGFRVPNLVISPFARRHYVSHIPMDHTAIIKFVENRFLGTAAHLTNRDAAQPDLLDFFDFNAIPWASPPNPPAPVTAQSLGRNTCTPAKMGP